jgi:hypothetical protein
MTNQIWPARLRTPYVPLGVSIDEGFELFKNFGVITRTEDDGDDKVYRISADGYDAALYERDGIVRSIWYDDPSGRALGIGRERKISLYLRRYRVTGEWGLRMENGWMRYYFNDVDGLQMVYGIHADVIRFNLHAPMLNSSLDAIATRRST